MQKITTFLMFEGQAEEAMNFYVSLFDVSDIVAVKRYGENDPQGVAGSIEQATISLNGQQFMLIDSSIDHGFTFTPAMSLFVTCDSEEEIDRLFAKLSDGGGTMMPLGEYGFSQKFAWISDRFGVSWQLNLPFAD